MAEMSNAAREAQNAYKRAWYKNNRDKQREYNARYWERKAAQQQAQPERQEKNED